MIQQEIADTVLKIGRAEWGATKPMDAEAHGAHVVSSVKKTAANFEQPEAQPMNGLYVEGTETVICHTGTSPNSPITARALTAAWNALYDQCALQSAPPQPEPQDNRSTGWAGSGI